MWKQHVSSSISSVSYIVSEGLSSVETISITIYITDSFMVSEGLSSVETQLTIT